MSVAAKDDRRTALLFLLPNILGFLAFTALPVLASLVLSFTKWDLLTPPKFVGFDNFVRLLGFHSTASGWQANDPDFWYFLFNTMFLMLNLPLVMAGSLVLALILNQPLRFSWGYRLLFYLPHIVAGVAIFYLWRWMYNPDLGLINTMLAGIGLAGPNWLSDPNWAKPALILMGFWIGVGGSSMILYLAALQNVPLELYEAAEIDGASSWQSFWAVTWPCVMPVTFFIFTMGLIAGFQAGTEMAYIMTGGGPYGSTTTLGFYIYQKAFVEFEMGYASAISWVLFVLILVITLINWLKGGRQIGA